MPIPGSALDDLWTRFAAAMGVEPGEAEADGSRSVRFADGLDFTLFPWRDEAAYQSTVAEVPPGTPEAQALSKRFLRVSLARAATNAESVFAADGRFAVWRRFRRHDDPDFSLDGIERFLNQADFWRRQVGLVETWTRRQAPVGGFINIDQFG
ncbi:MAG: hypothetical protein LUC93_14705 [Planctomycetaceae bacterium]|nr:hypothetical protein [Planctomycetaceae bacterium]